MSDSPAHFGTTPMIPEENSGSVTKPHETEVVPDNRKIGLTVTLPNGQTATLYTFLEIFAWAFHEDYTAQRARHK